MSEHVRERALPFSAGEEHELVIAVPHVTKLVLSYRLLKRIASIVVALGLFVFSLQLMKRGATGLTPILDFLSVHSAVNYLGFGWINAYLLAAVRPLRPSRSRSSARTCSATRRRTS